MIRYLSLLSLLLLAWQTPARADWINLTGAETAPNIAEIYVMDDHVRLVLEIYVGDLDTFSELVPDNLLKDTSDRPSLEQRLQSFSKNTLQFVTDSGEQLSAELALVEPRLRVDRQSPFAGMINPITRQRVPEPPADKRVLYAELRYPFSKQPQTLTFIPPRDDKGIATTTIGFIAYHKSVPIIDFRYLGQATLLNLDWQDPWYSKFDNPNLKRHHKSALMTFLYVEPYEVRHEVLVRVKDLTHWMDLGLRGDEYIEVDELEGLKQRIGEFLLTRNPVLIDGEEIKPILDRTNYVKVGIKGIQLLEQPERLEVSTAIVGVIITYLTKQLPQKVTVNWDLFTDQIQRIPATSIDPAGPLPTFIDPESPVHTWNNFLKKYTPPTVANVELQETLGKLDLPLVSIICVILLLPLVFVIVRRHKGGRSIRMASIAAVALTITALGSYPYLRLTIERPMMMVTSLDEAEASKILNGLLKNVYRAFDFRDESDVYDKLSFTVEGELLEEIYLQNRKSFAIKKAGGAQARVKDIEILSVKPRPAASGEQRFILQANWTASGTVGHWGHVHTRTNNYVAELTVQAMEGVWKIIDLNVLEESRLDPGTSPAVQDNKG